MEVVAEIDSKGKIKQSQQMINIETSQEKYRVAN